jgi:hypothetical protein
LSTAAPQTVLLPQAGRDHTPDAAAASEGSHKWRASVCLAARCAAAPYEGVACRRLYFAGCATEAHRGFIQVRYAKSQ